MTVKPKVIVFGVGMNYKVVRKKIIQLFDIVALVDNDTTKHGRSVDRLTICSPNEINNHTYDFIVITVSSPEASFEVRQQLLERGIPSEKIRNDSVSDVSPYTIDPLFFSEDLCYKGKQKLFAENIERVVLEVNSQCNRRCRFCTNSIVDRHTHNYDMSDEIFHKIINELAEIQYSSEICLSYFNEPLLCTKLFERIKTIKEKLPNVFLYAFTNGEFLTKEKLTRLSECGLDMLWIDIYTDETVMEYQRDEAHKVANELIEKIELPVSIDECSEHIYESCKINDMDVVILTRDFTTFASNRAESLLHLINIPKIEQHPKVCLKMFISYHIDHTGGVWPCPNFHPNFNDHKDYCLGNVADGTIFDIWLGKKYNDYREKHFFHRGTLPCRSCVRNFYTFIQNGFSRPFRDRPKIQRKLKNACENCSVN